MFDQGSPGQEGPVFLKKGEENMSNLSYPVRQDNQIIKMVEFYFEQQEHGGGGCNCVEIDINCEEECRVQLCNGSASIPRKKKAIWMSNTICIGSVDQEKKYSPLQFNHIEANYIQISFQIILLKSGEECYDEIDNFDEGIELSVRLLSAPDEWIPVAFIFLNMKTSNDIKIEIGHRNGRFATRGYSVEQVMCIGVGRTNVSINMGNISTEDAIQLRWLQTSVLGSSVLRDVWIIDNIAVFHVVTANQSYALLCESFDSTTLDPQKWPKHNIRNGAVMEYCNESNFLVFATDTTTNGAVHSKSFLTQILNLTNETNQANNILNQCKVIEQKFSYDDCLDDVPNATTTQILSESSTISQRSFSCYTHSTSSTMATTDIATTTPAIAPSITLNSMENILTSPLYTAHPTPVQTPISENVDAFVGDNLTNEEFVLESERRVMYIIMINENLRQILSIENDSQRVSQLLQVSMDMAADRLVLSYLLGEVISRTVFTPYQQLLTEQLLQVGLNILEPRSSLTCQQTLTSSTTIFASYDKILLTYGPINGTIIVGNIALEVVEVDLNMPNKDPVTAVDTSAIDSSAAITLTIPLQRLQELDSGTGLVRIVSALYRNVSVIFSSCFPENAMLGSDIIATTIQCGNESCASSKISSSSLLNVTIQFDHSIIVQNLLEMSSFDVSCVFLKILDLQNSILLIGNWSEKGCTKIATLSSNSRTVCSCNHLTHFAILLSPRPPEFNDGVTLSLQVIGYIGVGVSLLAMSFTVMSFILLKSLHTMRNYIHIHLCVSLAIAQIIFVVGVDKIGDPVPIHCQVTAVLLHYFFLVSFMWMLMEGIVLYVALVRVFITHHRRYIIAFTVASYGAPLLYMGLLTLPLGFGLQRQYGYERACFLNSVTGFIWSFIAPFILIFIANVGFFAVAARIMWRHQMKNTDKTKFERLKNWFRSAVSVMMVMSLTWIVGILIIEVDEVVPLAYIYTIMVAFQGLFIFIVFVPLSSAVREAYAKWWRHKVNESYILSKFNISSSSKLTPITKEGNSASSKPERKAQSSATKENLKSEVKHELHSKANSYTAQADPNNYETPC